MKNCTPLWREAHFEVNMYKARNVQNTPCRALCRVLSRLFSDHFWKLRCRKSACRCGAKHISKSKVFKNDGFGPLMEVEMLKKCTPLWREAHFEVKSVKKLTGSDHFWTCRCRFAWQAQGILHFVRSEQNVRAL